MKPGSSVSLKGQVSQPKLNDDDFNCSIKRFEIYILLNEINVYKKKLLFLTLLGNERYSLLRDWCIPINQLIVPMMC